jgi:hypothetical protein
MESRIDDSQLWSSLLECVTLRSEPVTLIGQNQIGGRRRQMGLGFLITTNQVYPASARPASALRRLRGPRSERVFGGSRLISFCSEADKIFMPTFSNRELSFRMKAYQSTN